MENQRTVAGRSVADGLRLLAFGLGVLVHVVLGGAALIAITTVASVLGPTLLNRCAVREGSRRGVGGPERRGPPSSRAGCRVPGIAYGGASGPLRRKDGGGVLVRFAQGTRGSRAVPLSGYATSGAPPLPASLLGGDDDRSASTEGGGDRGAQGRQR